MNVALVYPMAAMVLVTIVVLATLFRTRVAVVRSGELSAGFFKTYQGHTEPDAAAKRSRHLVNLFEAPTLFYAACITGLVIGDTSTWLLALAWLYVAIRIAHAVIHIGPNKLMPRMQAYFASWIVLAAMWLRLVWVATQA